MLFDVFAVTVLAFLGGSVLMVVRDRFTQSELTILWLSLAAHIGSMFAQQAITFGYYGGGDMYAYSEGGREIADAILREPGTFVPLTVQLLLQQDVVFPFFILGAGASTGSMVAVTGFIDLFTGSSLWGSAMVVTLWAFFGKVLLYVAFRQWFRPSTRFRIQIAMLLVPSVVFWSSAILKESVAVGAIGIMVFGLVRVLQRALLRGLPLMLFGALVVALIKPYILFPFSVAAGIWFLTHRSQQRQVEIVIKPVFVVLGLAVAVGGFIALSSLFPRYSLDNFNDETSRLQEVGIRVGGGSTYTLSTTEHRSAVDQVLLAPLALFTSLFRPLPPEVRNVLMGMNSVETLIIFIYALRAIWNRSWRWAWATVRNSPPLLFCVTFVILLGIGVGLACTNLGSLSRYRMPLVPFFAMVLLVLTAREAGTITTPSILEPASPQPQPLPGRLA
jgi:hypothetical protein